MAARTFTRPSSLNENLANSNKNTTQPEKQPAMAAQQQPQTKEDTAHNRVKHGRGVTFAHQDELPKLPIPDLEGTMKKYLDVLKPLQNKREQQDTTAVVENFLRNEGPELQARLKRYASGKTSYIEQFCKSTHCGGGLKLC